MSKQNTVFKDAYNRALALLEHGARLPSEPDLAMRLKVSRTTVRSVLAQMVDAGLIRWDKREKTVLRVPTTADRFPEHETDSVAEIIERRFMQQILAGGAEPGMQINELELARDIGVGTTPVREFLIRFSRFGLIEKRPNSHWVLKGFTRDFALELTEVREMFELRSAAAFVRLPPDHPAWRDLDAIEAEHAALLRDIDRRYSDFSELDERFHRIVHGASRNRFIIDFYDVIAIVFHYHYQWNKTDAKARNTVAIQEHLLYIAALRSGDALRVEDACRRHLASARATLLDSLAPVPEPAV